ncbi:MAG: DUF4091 domain-containing protein, partial [Clostridia bacterium]|nr:DUF4091 domain-containing protein [Clostridia bacterium]
MKKTLRAILLALSVAVLLTALAMGAFTSSAAAGTDPSQSYVKQTAPNEDSSLNLWFEHSFKKVFTSDITSSGLNTYSIYMAKNEIENAQFVLYSASTKAGMGATVTNFTDGKGNEIPAEIYYQMYVTVEGVLHNNIYGLTNSSQDYIREGEVPDPVYPLAKIGGKFQLNGGKSQAFYIRAKSSEDTPSGWYSAQLNITNSSGQIVKTATVFCYVWDFTISEKTELQTAFMLGNDTTYGGSYQKFYDYLLENRLMAFDVPGKLTEDNPYLTNPRVSAIRVSGYIEAGGHPGSQYDDHAIHYSYYTDIYNRLSNSPIWDEVKDKLYFYDTDEPLPLELTGTDGRDNLTDAYESRAGIDKFWGGENPKIVIPHGENHPFPYNTFTNEVKPLSSYSYSVLTDAEDAMLEDNLCTVWCPRIYGFTPMSEINTTNYKCLETSIIRTNSGPYSGNISKYANDYYVWENIKGEFTDRVKSEMAMDSEDIDLWAYSAGFNKGYSYANHIIENTGLQTKMLFWQLYQEDCTGYLYYASNDWNKQDGNTTTDYIDTTVTGGNTMCQWRTNRWYIAAHQKYIYGNGVLFYGASQARIRGVADYVGSIRVEMMRDGVEEYQMLKMLEQYKGEKAAKAVVARVSTNVVRYLSLPGFSTSAFSSSMDEYDIMASVRKDLGNAVEAAVVAGQCNHTWDSGTVTTAASCLKIGHRTYTCTKCGAQRDEDIPAWHSTNETFRVTSSTVSCTSDGTVSSTCHACGFVKTRPATAYHNDADYYKYSTKSATAHSIICTQCNGEIDTGAHLIFEDNTAPTCTEAGTNTEYCKLCSYTAVTGTTAATGHTYVGGFCTVCGEEEGCSHVYILSPDSTSATCTVDGKFIYKCSACGDSYTEIITAKGHSYSGGKCTVCGEADPSVVVSGDVNGDGAVNAMDVNVARRLISGSVTPSAAQNKAGDVNGDGTFNG